MFLNLEFELDRLNRWWMGEAPELITAYGRRQVGKTELLVRLFGEKRHVYFYADRQLRDDQLRAFTDQVLTVSADPVLRLQPFQSWEAALTYTFRLARDQRLAIVLDEFSYAIDADPSLPSVLQRLWDTARRESTRAFVVLCTSFTAAMERHFLIDGALYRRRTRELHIEPFTYQAATQFFLNWRPIERLLAWGILGGIPSYLQALRGDTLGAAVIEHVLDKSALLYREAETLLAQEVRGIGPALLRGMLQAIAYGCTEPNEIAQRVDCALRSALTLGRLRFAGTTCAVYRPKSGADPPDSLCRGRQLSRLLVPLCSSQPIDPGTRPGGLGLAQQGRAASRYLYGTAF